MLIGETEQDHRAQRLIMSRTCEMSGCRNSAYKLYSLVLGMNLWLCKSCAAMYLQSPLGNPTSRPRKLGRV